MYSYGAPDQSATPEGTLPLRCKNALGVRTETTTLFDGPLWWVRLGVAAGFLAFVVTWVARPWVAGDTPFVWDGTDAFIDCISRRDFVACRHSGELDFWGLTSPIGDWPLLQHVPDLVAIGLGADTHHTRELVFVLLGVAGVVGAVLLATLVLSRIGQPAWTWGFLAVVLSGPLIVYARTTFGEALATALLVCLVAATTLRAPPQIVALAVLAASLTKETSYPFVAALGVLGLLLASRRTGRPVRRHLTWGAAGLAVAIVAASLFNLVRFGSPLNTNYLEPELRTPGLLRPLEYSLALLVSPNGGIVVYWLSASALVLAACALPLAFRSRLRLDPRPALVLTAIVLGLNLGLATWWDIFGHGYGPRLTVPWVLPIVLLALVAYGEVLGDLARRLLAPTWRLLLVFAVVFASALPAVGHMWKPEAVGDFAAERQPPCDAPWRGGVEEWHACQSDLLWFDYRPRPLYSIEGVATTGGALSTVVLALTLLGCLILLRQDLQVEAEGRARGRAPDSPRAP